MLITWQAFTLYYHVLLLFQFMIAFLFATHVHEANDNYIIYSATHHWYLTAISPVNVVFYPKDIARSCFLGFNDLKRLIPTLITKKNQTNETKSIYYFWTEFYKETFGIKQEVWKWPCKKWFANYWRWFESKIICYR